MVGQADNGAAADLEIVGRDGHAAGAQSAALIVQVLQIDDDAVADDIDRGLAEDAGGQQVEDELALLIHDRVTGVVSALIAADYVIVPGEQVDHTALSLVAPVDSYDCSKHFPIAPFRFYTFMVPFSLSPRKDELSSRSLRTSRR